MINLSFPEFSFRVIRRGERKFIFDRVRRRYVALTPEEWVRQHMLHYLIDVLHYPSALMAVEKKLPELLGVKRADILIYDPTLVPWMIIECKAPDVPIQEQTWMQLIGYNFSVAEGWQKSPAAYLILTNGMQCAGIDCRSLPPRPLEAFPNWPATGASSAKMPE
ncbi:MAG: type I restriction enzyme HsdR N-terminal domain-containing protein [Thermoflavifilum sp.]|nr:type I restriction enzyme HsdR N-terminal domain-containing protein [Thermoflavifilum sp.]